LNDISTSETILAQQVIDLHYFNTSQYKLRAALKAVLIRRQNNFDLFNTCFDIYFKKKSIEESRRLAGTPNESKSSERNDVSSNGIELEHEGLLLGENDELQLSSIIATSSGTGVSFERQIQNIIAQRFLRWLPDSLKDQGQAIAFHKPENWTSTIDHFVEYITGDGQYLKYVATLAQRYNRFANQFVRAYEQVIDEITSYEELASQIKIIGQTEYLKEKLKLFLQKTRLNLLHRDEIPTSELLRHLYASVVLPDSMKILRTDFDRLQGDIIEVQRQLLIIGKKIAVAERRKRKRALKGRLNFRKTIRKNISSGGTLLELVLHRKKRKDPRILMMSDVSGSTEFVSEFFFIVCYAAQTTFRKISLFEFDNTTVEITYSLKGATLQQALKNRVKAWENPPRHRLGHSNYQTSLEDFMNIVSDRLTRDTTLLVLGDCRDWLGQWKRTSNDEYRGVEPESKFLLEKIRKRVKRVIILNPEHPSNWNTGDSVVKHYQEIGVEIHYVENLLTLINFVFRELW
jgi:uncharacterized protein with von Willebrand factor type A (vWA) domain